MPFVGLRAPVAAAIGAPGKSAVRARSSERGEAHDVAGAMRRAETTPVVALWPLSLLMLLSGATALVYEVLWLKELALLFGSTARSAAITLSVFFLGLALGNRAFGERAARHARPLRVYAVLEVGIAIAALSFFFLFDLYLAVYASLFQFVRAFPGGLLALKVVLSIALLLPAAFFMGGTLPLVAEHAVRTRSELGRTASLLYAANTLGGALGALLAGFWLPPILGYRLSCLTAIGVNLAVAAAAYAMAGRAQQSDAPAADAVAATVAAPSRATTRRLARGVGAAEESVDDERLPQSWIAALAVLSGFAALGLEVLWTRMFAQVLHNSVYSFAIILVTFLLALAAGAWLARVLLARAASGVETLAWTLSAAGIAVGTSPFVFYALTRGLKYLGGAQSGWLGYMTSIFGAAIASIGIPGLLVGAVFPLLLGLDRSEDGPGRTVGRLASLSTIGSIVGSLVAGFVMLEWLGLWASVRAFAIAYLVASLVTAERLSARSTALRAAPLLALVALVTIADPARLPRMPDLQNLARPPAVHRVWEGRDGTVAVVSVGGHLRTIVDNYYSLGSTEKKQYEETQADLPLLLHPHPRSVFFLGLGTGITAGAALRHRDVERVVTTELSSEVAEAARLYFKDHINGLFTDPRSEVVIDDGRQYLSATDETFDVIVSDLFLPWQAGTGSLYSKEHFETARNRLAPGGLFAQWLPLYQLSEDDFEVIVRTMLEVFPQVTLWRGDFLAERPIVALIGQNEVRPLDAQALVESYRRLRGSPDLPRESVLGLMAMFYAGNLTGARDAFANRPINTDDLPIIEYRAAVAHREQRAGRSRWLVGEPWLAWLDRLDERAPHETDPYLADFDAREHGYVDAGSIFLHARASARDGDRAGLLARLSEFRDKAPPEIATRFERQLAPVAKQASAPGPVGNTRETH